MSFDGGNNADDYVSAGSPASLTNLPTITVSAWIYPTGLGEMYASGIRGMVFGKIGGSTNGWALRIYDANQGTGAMRLQFVSTMNTANLDVRTSPGSIILNQWQYVTVTYTKANSAPASNVHIYINGTEASYSTQIGGSGIAQSDLDFNFMVGSNYSAGTFDGKIDEVRTYNRILTAQEISDLYAVENGGVATPPPAPMPPPPPSPTPTPTPPPPPPPSPTPTPPPPPPPASGSGNSSILIERQGEHSTQGKATAPYASTWVDSQNSSTQNTNLYSNLAAGNHTISTQDVNGLFEFAGTCTYAVGGSECSVTSFNISPTCNGTSCSINISTQADQVMKVSFKYIGIYEGFGQTAGGKNGTVYHVTNLNDSGAGSLRDAVSQSNRYVVFDVAGKINQTLCEFCFIEVVKKFITIDGFTSPGGITLPNSLILKDATNVPAPNPHTDTSDIIVRGIRIEKNNDGFQGSLWMMGGFTSERDSTTKGPYNVVIDHNTFSGSGDDQIGFESGTHDVTFSWNTLRDPASSAQNMLADGATRVSVHHNFFAPTSWRNPNISYHFHGTTPSPDLTIDLRNNFMFVGNKPNATIEATSLWRGASANIVNNYYLGSPLLSATSPNGVDYWMTLCTITGQPAGTKNCATTFTSSGGGYLDQFETAAAGLFIDGNIFSNSYGAGPTIDKNNSDFNTGTSPQPYSAPAITQTDAFSAACNIIKYTGIRPTNAGDINYINSATTELAKFGNCVTGVATPVPLPTPTPTPTPPPPPPPASSSVSATLSVSSTSIAPGASVTATWNITSGTAGAQDWVSIYRTGDANTAYGLGNVAQFKSTNGATMGTYTVTIPTAGTYEFRYLLNNGFTDIVRSSVITVTGTAISPIPTPLPPPPPSDTTSPTLSNISSSGITTSSTLISWNTNEVSDSQIEYGLTTSYGSQSTLNTSLLTSHSQTLSSLSSNSTYHYRVKSRDVAGNLATSLDNTFTTQAAVVIDTQAPNAISTLFASNTQTNSMDLTWTSPSDLPNNSAVASYDIRYSSVPITSANFLSSPSATGEPSPSNPGASQIYILAGLNPATTYYMAIVSVDSVGNISPLSNVPTQTTASLPTTPAPAPTSIPTPTTPPSSTPPSSTPATPPPTSGGGGGGGSFFQPVSSPSNFLAQGAPDQVVLTWKNPTSDSNFVRVEVLRDGTPIYEGDKEEFTDTSASLGTTHTYTIRSIDRSLNRSSTLTQQAKLGDKTTNQVIETISNTHSPQTQKFNLLTQSLKLGSRLSEVKILQQMLSVNPTGYYGALTRQAVINFQRQYNISQTGTVGPITRAKLNELYAGSTPSPVSGKLTGPFSFGMRSNQVKILQQMLGVNPTGYYGALTKAAVINFQKKYGIKQTGIAGPLTRAKLMEVYGN